MHDRPRMISAGTNSRAISASVHLSGYGAAYVLTSLEIASVALSATASDQSTGLLH